MYIKTMSGRLLKKSIVKSDKNKEKNKDNNEEEDPILTYYDYETIKDVPEITWIIQDVIPNNGLIIVYGAPGSGKTFIVLDMCLHIINNRDWFENKINESGIIVYLIGEGIYGIKKRLEAWDDYYNIQSPNQLFFVPISSINIWEEKNIERLKKTINKFINITGKQINMIVVDTLARASTGLDENSSRDMGMFLRNFEMIKEKFGCSIVFIHHKGKDESRGMRGSSSLLGAADTCIDVKKEENHDIIIKIEKQKDGENKSFNSRLIKHNNSLILCTDDEIVKTDVGGTLQHFTVGNIQTSKAKNKRTWTKEEDNLILRCIKRSEDIDKLAVDISIERDRIFSRFWRLIEKDKNNHKSLDKLIKVYKINNSDIKEYLEKKISKIESKDKSK